MKTQLNKFIIINTVTEIHSRFLLCELSIDLAQYTFFDMKLAFTPHYGVVRSSNIKHFQIATSDMFISSLFTSNGNKNSKINRQTDR